MSIKNRYGMTDFQCEICGAEFIEETGTTYDEARLAAVRAGEFGWYISQRGGHWKPLHRRIAGGWERGR
jgi:hypothetical protein